MGSGHILIAMFDVLMDIYESAGYDKREAAFEIVEHNIHGLDIDQRAYQLAYFAVMMKGRGYNRRFLRGRDGKPEPKVYAIVESNEINRNHLQFFGTHLNEMERNLAAMQIEGLLDTFKDAREYGSILNVDACDWEVLEKFVDDLGATGQISFESVGSEETQVSLRKLVRVAKKLGQKYDTVVTNPPYMGASGMGAKLSKYVKDNYPDSKSDMSTVMMECAFEMCKKLGYVSMINIPVWMTLKSYAKMRNMLLSNMTIENLVHFGRGVFGSDFGTTAFVLKKRFTEGYNSTFRKLYMKQGAVSALSEKERIYLSNTGYYIVNQSKFKEIEGSPIAYALNENIINAFQKERKVSDIGITRLGMTTADNNKFTRMWFEIFFNKLITNATCKEDVINNRKKWVPYNKGGQYRKWYGNNDVVVNWENDGYEIKHFADDRGQIRSTVPNTEYYFRKCITWSKVTAGSIAFRYKTDGSIFDVAGASLFADEKNLFYLQGFLNSKVALSILNVLSPTLNYEGSHIGTLPIKFDYNENKVIELVRNNIRISKKDWDSVETSWDFIEDPLIRNKPFTDEEIEKDLQQNIHDMNQMSEAYNRWQNECYLRFVELKKNEEELNRIFIDIYGLQDELTPEVEDKNITVRKADLSRDVRSFVSYAVGCMLGRYSLDEGGLIYAGDEWDNSKYKTFIPDDDNCIPITDEEYFSDDIVGRFVEFVKTVYGADTLEENLDFIANALGNKGDTSREVIRNYFLKDFYTDHLKVYQKRPIYWLFDSGKQNGFKALIYMHRYDADTVGRVRTDYLHRAQKYVETAMQNAQYTIDNASSASEKSKATKAVTKYTKQLAEMKIYDEAIAHIANKRIEIDLDDGVKVNYEKFQGVEVAQEGKKALKVDLLAKLK